MCVQTLSGSKLEIYISINTTTSTSSCSKAVTVALCSQGMDVTAYLSELDQQSDSFLTSHQVFAQQVLGFRPGDRGVVTNGKVSPPRSGKCKYLHT